jgi:uncharacterized membrane protein
VSFIRNSVIGSRQNTGEWSAFQHSIFLLKPSQGNYILVNATVLALGVLFHLGRALASADLSTVSSVFDWAQFAAAAQATVPVSPMIGLVLVIIGSVMLCLGLLGRR